jgi:hypothetical protein
MWGPSAKILAVALLLIGACTHETPPSGGKTMKPHLTAPELGRAVELAEQAVLASGTALGGLKLVGAVNMMAGREYRGPAYWRITFKRRDLIPKDADSELGAGGELFVDVDLGASAAKISGHGE